MAADHTIRDFHHRVRRKQYRHDRRPVVRPSSAKAESLRRQRYVPTYYRYKHTTRSPTEATEPRQRLFGKTDTKKHRGHDKIQTTHTYPARHRKRLYAADPAHDRKNRRKHHSPSVQEGHKTSDATPTVAPRRNKGAECNEA